MSLSLYDIGVTKAKVTQFNNKGIYSVEDLLDFLPRKYLDCTKVTGVLPQDSLSVLELTVRDVGPAPSFSGIEIRCALLDGTPFKIIWCGGTYLSEWVTSLIGQRVYCAGNVSSHPYFGYSMFNPLMFSDKSDALRLIPVYSKITGMSDNYLQDKLKLALRAIPPEPYPAEVAKQYGVCLMKEAYRFLHNPSSLTDIHTGKLRHDFDALLSFALQMEEQSRKANRETPFVFTATSAVDRILASLPYSLTPDQAACITALVNEGMRGQRINALIQGDVGCGKTILAFLSMVVCAESGYQAVLMAPTQVLAKQHYASLCELLGDNPPFGVDILTSDMTAKQQKAVRERVSGGKTSILIGTSSVLGGSIEYHNLGMVVVDEEHKFGVRQKEFLRTRASEGMHNITMSATPIPRSLASILHGETIELFTVKTMPAGRQPVATEVVTDKDEALEAVIECLREGRQAYIVCPAIDTNDSNDVEAVEDVALWYADILKEYGWRTAVLTGKTKKTELAEIMTAFQNNEIQLLVSTTVIEVGVNVPNACLMVVHNAERFGLSSLHQLRGRVGRGTGASKCVLISTREGNARLSIMCETNDGFRIAEADLQERGSGDLFGTKQSGMDKYVELILSKPELYQKAVHAAKYMLDNGIQYNFSNDD